MTPPVSIATIAGEVKNFDPLHWVEKKELKKMGRFIQIALAAADFAMQHGELVEGSLQNICRSHRRLHCVAASADSTSSSANTRSSCRADLAKISPFFIPSAIINLASGHVSIRYGARGPNSATATACSASAHAIGDSFKIIQRGDAEVMICGGSEAAITPMGIGGFAAMKALSTRNDEPARASRPFDAQRDGFVVGEGAGILILESLEHAQKRDAPIIAEIVGYGMSGDAYHITQPAEDGDGAYRVMRAALKDAKLSSRRYRLRQRARHFDADRRCHRNDRDEACLRRTREENARQLDEIDDRAPARRRRRTRSRHQRACAARSNRSADDQSTRTPIRPAISITFRTSRAKPKSSTRSRIRSVSAAPTPR